jgi:phosphatidylinositol alpha-mannosyltransferase
MKIAQVTEYFAPWPGGISEHVRCLAHELRGLGHDVRILTSDRHASGGAPLDAQLEPHTIRLGPGVTFPYNGSMATVTYSWSLPRRMQSLFEREGFDVVHIHNPMMPILPLVALDRSTSFNVGTFHAYHGRARMIQMWKSRLDPLMDRLHAAIAVSPAAQRAYTRYFDRQFEIVPNGIDLRTWSPNGQVPAENGRQSLLFVGQMVPKKGLPTLLDAFEMLVEEFPELVLRVVGDGPQAAACRARLRAPARQRVRFLGEVHGQALLQEYRDCDIFCAPSVGYESFGITLLEAMAAGKPIVASRIDGYCDVVRENREALLHRSRDPGDLRDALRRLITDAALRRRLGQQALRTVERYSWTQVAREIEACYERGLSERC